MIINKNNSSIVFIMLMFIILLFTSGSSSALFEGSDYGMISVLYLNVNTVLLFLITCLLFSIYHLKNMY
ncbi:hypothetical protein, partial [Exiguobacterium sp.]|uniref:hypothetical protein n=1 Tax=Exiguobacterium sp. TaxID=44751 RepID=UPI00289DCFF7